jgi:hypothetical protein
VITYPLCRFHGTRHLIVVIAETQVNVLPI